jgi:hypothetical protein
MKRKKQGTGSVHVDKMIVDSYYVSYFLERAVISFLMLYGYPLQRGKFLYDKFPIEPSQAGSFFATKWRIGFIILIGHLCESCRWESAAHLSAFVWLLLRHLEILLKYPTEAFKVFLHHSTLATNGKGLWQYFW